MIHQLTKHKNNKFPFTILLCIIAFTLNVIPILHVDAQRDEATVAAQWTFDDKSANDISGNGINGQIVGEPKSVEGIYGKALEFDGVDDGIKIPDSPLINTGGPYSNRTVSAFFNCKDISKDEKQVIFQEGGATRGLCAYVHKGEVYVGGWNRAQYNWDGAWISKKIKSNRWHYVALVLRDTVDKLENDKFEMWLDGELVGKESGGQLFSHTNDGSIGYTFQKTVYHDGVEDLSNVGWFDGIIDDVLVYNSAFDDADFAKIAQPLSVDPKEKYTTTWGYLKSARLE